MDRYPLAENGPKYELIALARTMDDLTPDEMVAPRPDGLVAPLIFAGVGLLALVLFLGGLLVT